MKMETAHHHHEEKKMRVLYEASYKGCVSVLNTLIQQDPLILYKISSRTIFIETPLHISALLGHLEFSKALLTHKPKLALELDSFRSTALHLASAEGHIDIVKELLLACDYACLIPDQEGRIPLHYAVIRGRTDVVLELIRVKPESLRILDEGKTIFHLCVIYNHQEILKALVELDIKGCMLLNSRDLDGNTILDLATMLKKVEIIKFLLSIPKIREAVSSENDAGFTDHMKFINSIHKQHILMNSSIKEIENSKMETPPQPPPSTITPDQEKGWEKILRIMESNLKHNGKWLEEMRGNLSLVATVISTITFQAVNNPPGGFVQQGISSDKEKPFDCFDFYGTSACPGDAVSAIRYVTLFHPYLKYNTIAFIASLTVILILISGVPLRHKAVIWMLSISMCITLTFLTLTYINGLYLVTPGGELFFSAWRMVRVSLWTWIGFLGVAALLITLRFVMWLVKKKMKKSKHQTFTSSKDRQRKHMRLMCFVLSFSSFKHQNCFLDYCYYMFCNFFVE